jgi:hypothetical protein
MLDWCAARYMNGMKNKVNANHKLVPEIIPLILYHGETLDIGHVTYYSTAQAQRTGHPIIAIMLFSMSFYY